MIPSWRVKSGLKLEMNNIDKRKTSNNWMIGYVDKWMNENTDLYIDHNFQQGVYMLQKGLMPQLPCCVI